LIAPRSNLMTFTVSVSGLAAVVATSIGPAGRHVTSATGQSSLKPRKEQAREKISCRQSLQFTLIKECRIRR